ncbi:MAG: glycosyltransferase [Candidatus Thermoplasmatota archaeon]|nr:glycosyltransferase [Candidatus Thermoplasmatota archaeon]MBS3790060.1 glycosyltransferase [Candidatus Thermoplasmatota archaeon]
MKIAYLCNYIRPFKSTTQYQRAKFLSAKHDLYLFLDKNEQIPGDIESKVTIFRSRFDSRKIGSGLLHKLWRIFLVLRLRKKQGIEAVYTLFSPHMILEGYILSLFNFTWIDDIWDHPSLFLESYSDNFFFKKLYSLSKSFLKKADLVILAIEPNSMSEFDLEEEKTVYITNGLNPELYREYKDKEPFDEFSVFFVGHLRKQRIELLIDSAAILKKRGLDFEYHLVGPIHDDVWLEKKVGELDLDHHITIHGKKEHDETLNIMARSHVCVLPFNKLKTTDCIYPIKLFEYMALGKPVVVTGLKGIKRIIDDNENGIVLNENTPEEIARKIIELKENLQLRNRLSKNAERTVDKFKWSDINEKIEYRIEELEKQVR